MKKEEKKNGKKVKAIEKEEVMTNEETEIEEIVETTEKKERKSVVKMVFNIIFWVIIIGLAIVWLIDFVRVRQNEEPMFCISKTTHTFEDGTVEECVGLGYKIYEYNRSSITNGVEFGPFFIKMRE